VGWDIQSLLQNLRFSLRLLTRNPGLAITILLTLALGIGANTAIFTVVYATLLAPLPYPQPEQMVMVWSTIQGNRNGVSAGDFLDWNQQNTVFQDLNAWTGTEFNVATKEQPEDIQATESTAGMLRMQAIPLFLGRYFLPEEGQDGRDHVVILTHKFWLKLGADRHIIGTTLRLNDEPYTVVGVQQPGSADRGQSQVTVPLVFKPEQTNHDFHWLLVMGRLKPGVTIQQAQENMNAVTAHIAQANPKSDTGWGARVEPLKDDFLPPSRIKMLWLLLGAVGFVLLIACVNVANLLLARGMARQKEMAVRSALGARRSTIFAQLLTESVLLALAGGALGVAVAFGLLQGLIAVMPRNTLPDEAVLRLNIPVLLFTLAATTLAGLLAGCAPAWYASRIDPAETLKEGGRGGTSVAKHRLRQSLVIGEFALALTLLAGAGLAIHSFWNLSRVDLGVTTDHVLVFSLPVLDSRPTDPAHIVSYYHDILAHIDAVPGVSHATAMTGYPLFGTGFGMPFTIAGGASYANPSLRPTSGFGMVTPDYFATLGVQVEKGRLFTAQDTADTIKVAMVNESFVKSYLNGKDPLEQRVIVEQLIPGVQKLGPPIEWQIIGVYRDVHAADWQTHREQILVPFWQIPWPQATVAVRTAEKPESMLHSIAAAVHEVDSTVALAQPESLEQIRDESVADERFTLILFGVFAAAALFLAALGIYGVMAFSVTQRSHEIALRMALGAGRKRVVSMIMREGVLLAGIGLVLGLASSYFVGRAMQSMLFEVKALDASALGAVSAVLLVAALLACWMPAHRAASTEPLRALRTE
jgi:putative ABC transport system permease protein